ncbi:MAG: hypothetical protein WC095_00885 [Candidatus Paceibacterota bacterium]
MRKLVSYIFIFILLVGIFTPFSVTYGVEAPTPTSPDTPNSATSGTLGSNEQDNKAGDKKDDLQIQSQDACGFICWGILVSIQEISYWILQLTAFLLWLAGMVLDKALLLTIVNFSENIKKMDGIQTAWILIRDLMNMAFVFLLLYQGLRMILGRSNNAKNVIFGIVLASILVNFSLFMTKVIIDASNVVTVGFYNAIVEGSQIVEIKSVTDAGSGESKLEKGLSGAYVNSLGVNNFYDKKVITALKPNQRVSIITITLGGSIMFLMVSVIFLVIAVMLIIRYAVLIILMMLSPLAVMGIGIPKIQSLQNRWWEALLGQSLFAPAYMIMTWVILTLINSPGFNPLATNGKGWSDLFLKGDINSVGLVINFAVILVLTLISLTVAKEQASKGGVKMGEWTGKITSFAGGVALGGAAMAGRNTIGRGADWISKREGLKDAASAGGVGGFFAKNVIKSADRTATSSFDVRSTELAKQAKNIGLDLGKGLDRKKFNLRAIQEQKGKDEAAFAEKLKPGEDLYDEARAKDKEAKDKLKTSMDSSETVKNESNENLKNTEKNVKKLREELEEKQKTEFKNVSADEEVRIRKRIEELNKQIPQEEKMLEKLKETTEKNNEDYSKAKKAFDDYKSKEEDVIKEIYKDRVNTYANALEDESKMSIFVKDILLKIPSAGLIGGSTGHTKGDNRIIARKVRGVIKENKKVTKKSLKDLGIDLSDDKEESTESDNETPPEDNKTPEDTTKTT